MGCEQLFVRQLRERGFRLTPQREMVLGVMHGLGEFATADEVYDRVRALSSAVDLSTVYRTLDLLQEFDLVACIDAGDGKRRYALLGLEGPHLHLVCQSCGVVVGVESALLEPLAEQVAERYGFGLDVDHLTLAGWCQKCRNAAGPAEAELAATHAGATHASPLLPADCSG
jgi:Fur family ferric uptake transcriptional regulator